MMESIVATPMGDLVIKSSLDTEHPGVYIDLRRRDLDDDAPLALIEYCGDEGDCPGPQIITRVWGNVNFEDYTDRIVHCGFDEFFQNEV